MTEEPKLRSAERKRLAHEQTTAFAKRAGQLEKKLRDEKTERLRDLRLAKSRDN
jgi:hypothetical protein